MSVVQLNKSIKILDNEVVQVTKLFAENNLSKTCLDYSDYKDDKYYEWSIGTTAYAVMFELPQIFQLNVQSIYAKLSYYCPDFVVKAGINNSNYVKKYKANYDKKLVFKNE